MVDTTNREAALVGLGEIQNRINDINRFLKESDTGTGDHGETLDATYVGNRPQAAIDLGNEIVEIAKWLLEVKLSQTPATTPDNARIDAINPNIRTAA